MSAGEAVASTAAGTITASIVTGFVSGSAAPGIGNVAGAIVGLGVGLGLAYAESQDINGNGKTVREDVKDWFYGLVSGCEKKK